MRPMTGRERALLLVLFIVLYGAGFVFWVYLPYTQRISGLQATLDEKQGQLDAAIAIFHRLDDINSRIAALTAEMESLDRLVPGDNRAANFLYACGQWERQTGARVRDMAFNAPSATGDYSEYTVSFIVAGTYSAQVLFLANLEGLDRLVRVDFASVAPENLPAPPTGGDESGGEGGTEGGSAPPAGPQPVDMTMANYVVHLFVDPSKAAAAAEEEPGLGLTFTLGEGRKNPFLP